MLVFHHCPNTRSGGVLALLGELGASYELHLLNMKAGENRAANYLAINPMGKVPAITHHDALVTEQVAIFLYLADLYPAARLAPPMGDPLRGPYLRWMVFYGSSFEPALVDKHQNCIPPRAMAPYGDYDTMLATLFAQLDKGPYMLGDRFTAVDVLWGSALRWTTGFGLVPKTPTVEAYIARVCERPEMVKARAHDEELAKQCA